jgi:hypothetical protein
MWRARLTVTEPTIRCTAHDTLDAIGMETFAASARRILAAGPPAAPLR